MRTLPWPVSGPDPHATHPQRLCFDDSPIRLITCRHEGPATHMAEASAQLRGRCGVALVTRAPGATPASVAVHTAFQDSTLLVLLIGQVARETSAGRRGPVVLALPEDMLTDCVDTAAATPRESVLQHPGLAQVQAVHELLGAAERPLLVLGGSGRNSSGTGAVSRYAERMRVPVACAFRRQDLFDNAHANCVGDLGLGASPALVQRMPMTTAAWTTRGQIEIPVDVRRALGVTAGDRVEFVPTSHLLPASRRRSPPDLRPVVRPRRCRRASRAPR